MNKPYRPSNGCEGMDFMIRELGEDCPCCRWAKDQPTEHVRE